MEVDGSARQRLLAQPPKSPAPINESMMLFSCCCFCLRSNGNGGDNGDCGLGDRFVGGRGGGCG